MSAHRCEVQRRAGRTRATALATFYAWLCTCGEVGRWTRQYDTAATGRRLHLQAMRITP